VAAGFEWVETRNPEWSVLAFERIARDGLRVLCVFNFTPVPREGYRVGVLQPGTWAEILNTDAGLFAGSGVGNAGAVASDRGGRAGPRALARAAPAASRRALPAVAAMSGVSRDALILAGDIGGTHTRFALVAMSKEAPQEPRTLAHEDLASVALLAERGTLEDAAWGLPRARRPRHAQTRWSWPVRAPVRGGESRITNLPWVVREDALRAATGATHVRVVNDFEAMARGTLTLHDHELEILQQGERDPHGARLVLGAGTGLGQAWVLASHGTRPRVFTSEGGHVSFAPRDAFEDGLSVAMRARYGRVSVERVVSGLGLVHLYEHIVDTGVASTTEALRFAVERDGARAVGEAQEDAGSPRSPCSASPRSMARTRATPRSRSCPAAAWCSRVASAPRSCPRCAHAFVPGVPRQGPPAPRARAGARGGRALLRTRACAAPSRWPSDALA
jgi:glucokinase